jgi:protein tyrosine/serine phosphatase
VDREIVLPILDARPQYLNVALELIDTEAGGMDAFLRRELGVGAAERERLVERFTHAP